MQGDFGEFGWAVEAEGKADRTHSAINVELHVCEAVKTVDVLSAHGRKHQRADDGQAHLATVGVPGEHKVDKREARVAADFVGVVRLVREQNDGGHGLRWNGGSEVRDAGSGIVDAAQPDAIAAALDRGEAVDKGGDALVRELANHHGGVNGDVMVAKDGEALGAAKVAKDVGADRHRAAGYVFRARAAANKVSGKNDKIGSHVIGLAYDAAQKPGLGPLDQVHVADLRDPETAEGVGKIANENGAADHFQFVTAMSAGI